LGRGLGTATLRTGQRADVKICRKVASEAIGGKPRWL
jgi:hypothetical protein